MSEEWITRIVMLTLLGIVGYMIRNWQQGWELRIVAQDERLDRHGEKHNEHDVNHATLKNDLDHIKETSDETRQDVKELLRINGNRAT